jgi:hypothetical protein
MTDLLRLVFVSACMGLVVAGCSESSSGGGSKSTASGATASGTTTGGATSGTPTNPSSIPQAPASVAGVSGAEIFNQELQDAWDHLAPELLAKLQQELQAQAGTVYSNSVVDVEVQNLVATNSNMAIAPGWTHFSDQQLRLRLPQHGAWDLVLEGDVRVTLSIGSFSPYVTVPVKITISNLSMEVEVEFDHADATRPVLRRVGTPNVQFDVRIDSSSSLLSQITPVLTPVANYFAHRTLNNALAGLMPTLSNVQGMPGPVPGAGAPPLADSGVATPFAEIMANIDAKIRRDHMPHGMILGARMDVVANDSWETAYVNGGPGNAGTVVHHESGGLAGLPLRGHPRP